MCAWCARVRASAQARACECATSAEAAGRKSEQQQQQQQRRSACCEPSARSCERRRTSCKDAAFSKEEKRAQGSSSSSEARSRTHGTPETCNRVRFVRPSGRFELSFFSSTARPGACLREKKKRRTMVKVSQERSPDICQQNGTVASRSSCFLTT